MRQVDEFTHLFCSTLSIYWAEPEGAMCLHTSESSKTFVLTCSDEGL